MIKYVREGRVPNVMAIFMIFCKDKGLLYANMWKGVRNKGRWLGQAYKGTAEITLELYLLKKKTYLKSAHRSVQKKSRH